MGFLFGKDKKAKERDRLFERVKTSSAAGDMGGVTSALLDIRQHPNLHQDPEFNFLLDAAITGMQKKNLSDAIGLVSWALNYFDDTDARESLIAKAFSLAARVDRKDLRMMASVAMTMLQVADSSFPGSEEQLRAKKEWSAAFDVLAAKREGLDYAFAAASNAAIGLRQSMPLRKEAIQKWDEIVMDLAKTDRRGALTEAFRVANGYDSFGTGSAEIRARASSVIARIKKMKP